MSPRSSGTISGRWTSNQPNFEEVSNQPYTVDDVFAATRPRWNAYQDRVGGGWPPAGAERDALLEERRAIARERVELAAKITNPRERTAWVRKFTIDATWGSQTRE